VCVVRERILKLRFKHSQPQTWQEKAETKMEVNTFFHYY